MAETSATAPGMHPAEPSRRDFLTYAASGAAVVAAGLAAWPFIDSMEPSADTLALSSIEVDIKPIGEGQRVTVAWRGKPVFIDHRTKDEIDAARKVVVAELRDPQKDEDRVKKPEWLIMVGICTHLGCVPLGQKPGDPKGEFAGW